MRWWDSVSVVNDGLVVLGCGNVLGLIVNRLLIWLNLWLFFNIFFKGNVLFLWFFVLRGLIYVIGIL